jgi:hypothetical protein
MEEEDINRIAKKIVEIQKEKENISLKPKGLESRQINYKSLGENLQEGMKDLNKGINSIPHLVIGKKDETTSQKPLFSGKEALWIEKIKKWGLVLIVLIIVGYALFRIIGVIF